MIKSSFKKIIPSYLRYYVRHAFFSSPSYENLHKKRNFYSYFIREGDLVFDVGANLGNRIRPFLELKSRIIAVEPQKNCIKYLRLMFGRKIVLVNKGLGSEEGLKKFYISDSSTISTFSQEYINAVSQSGRFGNNKWNKTEEIEITTLDKLIQLHGMPAFIKIDVEGFEKEVLSGLSRKVNALSFEYCVPEQTNKAFDCINILTVTNPGMKYNFSTGETMEFDLETWLSSSEMLEMIKSERFLNTGFGDIYGKHFE